jgi:hypothetical protein
MVLVGIGALSMPMFCWLIARKKGRTGRKWLIGSSLATALVPACGGLVSLIVAAVMPKVGEPITDDKDKTILYCAIGCLVAGIAGFGMLVPAIMTIAKAIVAPQ